MPLSNLLTGVDFNLLILPLRDKSFNSKMGFFHLCYNQLKWWGLPNQNLQLSSSRTHSLSRTELWPRPHNWCQSGPKCRITIDNAISTGYRIAKSTIVIQQFPWKLVHIEAIALRVDKSKVLHRIFNSLRDSKAVPSIKTQQLCTLNRIL